MRKIAKSGLLLAAAFLSTWIDAAVGQSGIDRQTDRLEAARSAGLSQAKGPDSRPDAHPGPSDRGTAGPAGY
ncbi:hypothetical protein JW899_01305 [Candidatus Uhrbacteria bacterium]|nr:hypothetical protein [Candidatus Uhrbacteria bacterium]